MTTTKRATKKAPAKKTAARKTAAKKTQPKTVFEMIEDSPVGMPIRVANKTFLASLGVVSRMQTEWEKFQSDFDKRFQQLVKDGEKARKRYQKTFKDLRKDVADEIDETIEEVVEDVTELKDRIVENVSAATK